ncbi:hypothetical protein JG687_00003125 [Phytophthora cactorum]|uniref:Uncharacterized protein n=1 Tax=Phytophthora cactorum TaxID=29920 RepID=A0A8T1UWM6_9STRA|nr:hypothetical protein JG687_00003125 [Phytophthora cactorum]
MRAIGLRHACLHRILFDSVWMLERASTTACIAAHASRWSKHSVASRVYSAFTNSHFSRKRQSTWRWSSWRPSFCTIG